MSDFAPGGFNVEDNMSFGNPKFHDFLDFLGLVERDSKGTVWKVNDRNQKKLERLYTWAAYKAKSSDHDAVKQKLYELKKNIGVNWQGEALVDKLWEHTMFDRNFNRKLEQFVTHQETPKEVKKEPKTVIEKTKPAEGKPVREIDYKPEVFKNTMPVKEAKTPPPARQYI